MAGAGIAGAALLVIAAWSLIPRQPAGEVLKARPLTSQSGLEVDPDFSPDGSKFAYAWREEGGERFKIWVRPLAAGDPHPLSNAAGGSERCPAWSPDGNWIAFFGQCQGRAYLLVAPSWGGAERRIGDAPWTGRSTCEGLAWSPDSETLVAPLVQDPDHLALLHAASVATGERRRLIEPPPGGSDIYPAISPDGKMLAFSRVSNYGMARRIYLAGLSPSLEVTGEPKPLAQEPDNTHGIAWYGSERRLVYLTNCCAGERSSGFWTLRVDRPNTPRLLFPVPGAQVLNGLVSRDGRRLAYVATPQGNTCFWRVALDKGASQESPA